MTHTRSRVVGRSRATETLLVAAAIAGTPVGLAAQRAAQPADFLALTRCEAGRAVTQVRPDLSDSALVAEVEAHERVHREQAGAFPSCEAFMARLRSARQIIEVELPAYCAQWRVAVRHGADSAVTRREYAWRIAAQSGAMENRLDLARRLERECP